MMAHHNPKSIANVLSLKSMASRHHVTYDSKDRGGVFKVHTPSGVVEFKPSKHGLYYLDMAEHSKTFHHMLGTTMGEHERMVHEKLIANFPITVHNIRNANQIYGPNLTNLGQDD